jgi:CheY-like chemotaxis protein
VYDDGGSVRVRVQDTGGGVPTGRVGELFEPFFTTKPEGEGTGLGLATAFGIVRQSGGTLSVESAVGQGTTFTVALPRGTGGPAPAVAGAAPDAPAGTERILVVEDEEGVRGLVRRVLEAAGYAVVAAAGPEEALALAGEPYDLLITDLLMPAMTGRDLADRLRTSFPDLRVLYISGFGGDTMIDRGLLAPGQRFLSKPFSPQALQQHVRAVLDDGG